MNGEISFMDNACRRIFPWDKATDVFNLIDDVSWTSESQAALNRFFNQHKERNSQPFHRILTVRNGDHFTDLNIALKNSEDSLPQTEFYGFVSVRPPDRRYEIEDELYLRNCELDAKDRELNFLYNFSVSENEHSLTYITERLISSLMHTLGKQIVHGIQIEIHGETYRSDPFDETHKMKSFNITAWKEQVGTLQIYFTDNILMQSRIESISLTRLLEAVCSRYGTILQRVQSEDVYHSLVEGSLVGLAIFQDYRIVFANQMIAEITGYTIEELYAMPREQVFALVPHEDRAQHLDDMRRRLLGEAFSAQKEIKMIRKNGEIGWVESHAKLIYYRGRRADQLVFTDISERKKLEQEVLYQKQSLERQVRDRTAALAASEEKFKKLFDYSPTMIVLANLQTRVIEDVNKAYCDMLKITDRNAYLQAGNKLGWRAVNQTSFENLMDRAMASNGIMNADFQNYDSEGVIHDLRFSAVTIDFNGEPLAIINAVDVTEERKAQRKLVERERFYQSLIDSSRDGYVFLNVDFSGKILECNDAFVEMLGYEREELLQLTIHDIEPQELPPWQLDSLVKQLYEKGFSDVFFQEYTRKNGDRFPVEICAYRYTDNDTNKDVIWAVVRDITERKRQEEALHHADKMASLGVLVSGIAHEINNPNNFILLNIGIITDIWNEAAGILASILKSNHHVQLGGLPISQTIPLMNSLLSGITDGGRRIKRIVEDLKGFARKDEENKFRPVDMSEVLNEAIALTRSIITKSTNHFSTRFPEEPIQVQGNKQKLTQVVINLIQNACDALTSKSESISVSLSAVDECCLLTVADTGCGIRAEELTRVTDPFFTTKRERGGTGLGLSISAGIVQDHNGTIQFQSQRPGGTTVHIQIPLLSNERTTA